MPFVSKKQWTAAQGMAARKIQQAFRARRTKKVTTVAQVAKIARQVTLRAAETKSYISSNLVLNPLDGEWRVQNLIFNIPQTGTAEGVIGEKLFITNMRFRATVGLQQPSLAGLPTRYGRVVIFKTKKPLTNSSIAITATDLVRAPASTLTLNNHIDLHKVTLLRDFTFKMPLQNTAGQLVLQQFDFNIPVNKTEYFDADNSGYLKNMNYYLAYTAYDGNGVAQVAPMSYQYSVNFKDE